MVGKGFIQVLSDCVDDVLTDFCQDAENIICPECARKKMIEEIEEQ